MKETIMKNRFAVLGGVVLAVLGTGILGCQQKNNNAAGQSGSGSASTSARSSKVSWSGARQVEIPDPHYGIVAATLNIPDGWKFAGTMVRTQGCHASQGASRVFTALAQDGITASVALPGFSWGWSSSPSMVQRMAVQQHCPGIDITTAAKFLTDFAVPTLHPHAKIVGLLPLPPEAQANLEKQHEQLVQQAAGIPEQFRMQNQTLDGGRVRVQYIRNGTPVEEMITVWVSCYESTMPAPFKSGEPPSQLRHCSTPNGVFIVRAPQGHLDDVLAAWQQPHAKELTASFKVNPEWQNRVFQDGQAAAQQSMAASNAMFQQSMANSRAQFGAMVQRGQAFQAQQQSSFNSAMANDRAKQAQIDASAHNMVNYSLDRQDYVNPANGQTVTATSGYNHQYVDQSGNTMVQSNNPMSHAQAVSEGWTELVPK
jgi:hypothetical protein